MRRDEKPDRRDTRETLAAAYDACAVGMYRLALMILADPNGAEDAVQQTFAKVAAMGDRAAGLAVPEQYLRRAVRNECYRMLSQRQAISNVEERTEALLEPVSAGLEDQEQRRAIEAALRKLPAEQREVIHCKVYEGMTLQEIADFMDVPLNTVASRYRYATEKLRALLMTMTREGGE